MRGSGKSNRRPPAATASPSTSAPTPRSTNGTWTKYIVDDVKRLGNGNAAASFFHHRDHLKTIRLITDAAGTVVQRTTYAPYGNRALVTGTHTDAKGFIGERHDTETGYLYLNARYYDPALARFVSPDWWDPHKKAWERPAMPTPATTRSTKAIRTVTLPALTKARTNQVWAEKVRRVTVPIPVMREPVVTKAP